jgi:hydroxymethylpyrimidine/phosphomethylpyrimidine kinase
MITPVALTIAGSDPSGGAGIQADLKTFHQFGVYGEAVITLITVQNTHGIRRVHLLDPDLVVEQIRAVIEDIRPQAAKTGALGNAAIGQAVSKIAESFEFPLVVDPVTISKHGAPLWTGPPPRIRTYLLTPNLSEATALAGFPVDDLESMRRAAIKLAEHGVANVLIKGGHLRGDAVDLLYTSDSEFHEFAAPRIETPHTHGTGCTYSAAITAELARGTPLLVAIERAKAFITNAIRTNPGLGKGAGPLNHFARA